VSPAPPHTPHHPSPPRSFFHQTRQYFQSKIDFISYAGKSPVPPPPNAIDSLFAAQNAERERRKAYGPTDSPTASSVGGSGGGGGSGKKEMWT
jgi:hypothetical protein